jgi:carbohydrate-binding DOMON domain-containing protein
MSYRAVGSGTGQYEFIGKDNSPAYTAYNQDFGSGDIPIERVRMHDCTDRHTYTHTHTYTCTHTHTRTNTKTYTDKHTHIHTQGDYEALNAAGHTVLHVPFQVTPLEHCCDTF